MFYVLNWNELEILNLDNVRTHHLKSNSLEVCDHVKVGSCQIKTWLRIIVKCNIKNLWTLSWFEIFNGLEHSQTQIIVNLYS